MRLDCSGSSNIKQQQYSVVSVAVTQNNQGEKGIYEKIQELQTLGINHSQHTYNTRKYLPQQC